MFRLGLSKPVFVVMRKSCLTRVGSVVCERCCRIIELGMEYHRCSGAGGIRCRECWESLLR